MLFQMFANGHGANPWRRRAAPIKLAQESHAPARIMFPAVLAVENDANQCWLIAIDGVADIEQMPREVLRGRRRFAALIMKADHVAKSMIAKDNAQFRVALVDLISPIHMLGIDHVPMLIAADKTLR